MLGHGKVGQWLMQLYAQITARLLAGGKNSFIIHKNNYCVCNSNDINHGNPLKCNQIIINIHIIVKQRYLTLFTTVWRRGKSIRSRNLRAGDIRSKHKKGRGLLAKMGKMVNTEGNRTKMELKVKWEKLNMRLDNYYKKRGNYSIIKIVFKLVAKGEQNFNHYYCRISMLIGSNVKWKGRSLKIITIYNWEKYKLCKRGIIYYGDNTKSSPRLKGHLNHDKQGKKVHYTRLKWGC